MGEEKEDGKISLSGKGKNILADFAFLRDQSMFIS